MKKIILLSAIILLIFSGLGAKNLVKTNYPWSKALDRIWKIIPNTSDNQSNKKYNKALIRLDALSWNGKSYKDSFTSTILEYDKGLKKYSVAYDYDFLRWPKKNVRYKLYDFLNVKLNDGSSISKDISNIYKALPMTIATQYLIKGVWVDSIIETTPFSNYIYQKILEKKVLTTKGMIVDERTTNTYDSFNSITSQKFEKLNKSTNKLQLIQGLKSKNVYSKSKQLLEMTFQAYDISSNIYRDVKRFQFTYNSKNEVQTRVTYDFTFIKNTFDLTDSTNYTFYRFNKDWTRNFLEVDNLDNGYSVKEVYTYQQGSLFDGFKTEKIYNSDSNEIKSTEYRLNSSLTTFNRSSQKLSTYYNNFDLKTESNYNDVSGKLVLSSYNDYPITFDKDDDLLTSSETDYVYGSNATTDYLEKNFYYYDSTIQFTSIEDISKTNAITLFPNPTSNGLNVKIGKGFHHLMIYSSSGKMMKEEFIQNEGIKNIDVASLPSGLYFIQDISKEGKAFGKFIKD